MANKIMTSTTLIFGHRGYRSRFPENTILAFLKAVEYGADGVECDIQKTGDDRYIVFHDPVLDHLTDSRGALKQLSLSDIKKAKVKGHETIPTLEEFLAAFPRDKLINIELKKETLTIEDCLPIHQIIQKYFPSDQILISSFYHPLLRFFKKKRYPIGMLIGEEYEQKRIPGFLKDYLRYFPDYLNLPVEIFSHIGLKNATIFLKFLKFFRRKIAFWTVNRTEDWHLVKNWTNFIITDEVELISRLVGKTGFSSK